MTSFITALLTFALLSLPGWIVAMRARASLGMTIAAGVGSLFLVLLLSALIAELVGPLPAWFIYVVALPVAAAAYLGDREARLHLPAVAPVQLAFPAFCAAIAFAAYSLAFQTGGDPAIYRAWYNADWFKHLAHVNSAANFGFPLGDIFAGGSRLHYYWLFYLLPGAGASLHGDAQGALIAINLVIVFIFWLLLQEVLKACGVGAPGAAVLAFAGWSINVLSGIALLVGYRFDVRRLLDERSIDPGMLMEVNSYIPQHAIMLCGLLAFILLVVAPGKLRHGWLLAAAPAAAAGATSTLLGASVVAICCSLLLLLPGRPLPRRILEAAGLGLIALAVVFALQVVVPSLGQGSLGSPVFASGPAAAPPVERFSHAVVRILASLTLALPIGVVGIAGALRARDPNRSAMALAAALVFGTGAAATLASALLLEDARLAGEIALRNQYLLVIGLLMGIALLLAAPSPSRREKRTVALALAATVALSLPTVVLNFRWLGWSGPRWQLQVPRDDMTALAHLRTHSPKRAVVLQYPEPVSFLMGGRDTWVPILAGRTIPASYRSTSWAESAPLVAQAERFYAGDAEALPGPGVDWIYLSRSLHPASYDLLVARLERASAWDARLVLPGASLFARTESADQQRGEREHRIPR